jgi:hypothetical protein
VRDAACKLLPKQRHACRETILVVLGLLHYALRSDVHTHLPTDLSTPGSDLRCGLTALAKLTVQGYFDRQILTAPCVWLSPCTGTPYCPGIHRLQWASQHRPGSVCHLRHALPAQSVHCRAYAGGAPLICRSHEVSTCSTLLRTALRNSSQQ